MIDSVIIGAGQAGLSTAYYLMRKGLKPGRDFVVLDRNNGPGGAWRDRWDSLTVGGAHRIHPLPGSKLPPVDPLEPARLFVTRYYAAYEDELDLSVIRPALVHSVRQAPAGQPGFLVDYTDGRGREHRVPTLTVINASGTWNRPFIPHYPGIETFPGKQVHTRTFVSAREFEGQRVLVVGGGTSAVQFVQELASAGARPIWSTRSTPRWTRTDFDQEWGARVEDQVAERTTRGLPPLPVVATTGIPLEHRYLPDLLSGLLISRGPILRFDGNLAVLNGPQPDGSGFPSQGVADSLITPAVQARVAALPGFTQGGGWATPIDSILWATGFRHDLAHLRPLKLRSTRGGIQMEPDEVSVAYHPGIYLTGYGAAASTRGAVWAGRRAAAAALQFIHHSEVGAERRQ